MLQKQNVLRTALKSILIILCILYLTSVSLAQPWTTKTPIPTARNLMSIGIVNGIIYTIGGSFGAYSSTSVVEAYDSSRMVGHQKNPYRRHYVALVPV